MGDNAPCSCTSRLMREINIFLGPLKYLNGSSTQETHSNLQSSFFLFTRGPRPWAQERGCRGADGATAADRAGARPMAGTGPRHTMGLCVHPALPWSRAGQAGIWGQARNSFPSRGPPRPLPGCTALWGVGRQAPPSPLASPGSGMGTCPVAGTGE